MKPLRTLPVVIVLAIVVATVGCTPLREADGYETAGADRVYVDDRYGGTLILERDPYTGRYYEVGRIGTYSNRYGGYDPYYRSYPRYRPVYRTPRQTTPPPPPTQEQIRQKEKNRQDARNRVLGGG